MLLPTTLRYLKKTLSGCPQFMLYYTLLLYLFYVSWLTSKELQLKVTLKGEREAASGLPLFSKYLVRTRLICWVKSYLVNAKKCTVMHFPPFLSVFVYLALQNSSKKVQESSTLGSKWIKKLKALKVSKYPKQNTKFSYTPKK